MNILKPIEKEYKQNSNTIPNLFNIKREDGTVGPGYIDSIVSLLSKIGIQIDRNIYISYLNKESFK